MKKSKHNEQDVLRSLKSKNDVHIAKNSRTVQLLEGSGRHHDLGIASHGKIDFLVNHLGYRRYYTKKYIA